MCVPFRHDTRVLWRIPKAISANSKRTASHDHCTASHDHCTASHDHCPQLALTTTVYTCTYIAILSHNDKASRVTHNKMTFSDNFAKCVDETQAFKKPVESTQDIAK